jgi:group I intron endonuclease
MITYRAVNTKNGKWYVGSTTNFKRRKKEHLCSRAKSPFYNALRRDPSLFVWEILEEDDRNDRLAEELILAAWHGSEYCYNLRSTAVGFDSETARKIGIATWNRLSTEQKTERMKRLKEFSLGERGENGKSISTSNRYREIALRLHAQKDAEGKSLHAKKAGKVMNERKHAKRDEFGRSIAARNSAFGKQAKKIRLTNINTGEELVFDSSATAALELGLSARYLRRVAAGQRPKHKGWHATFLSD